MTFNTGNNVSSNDPRDLYDNAANLDKLVNGSDPFVADRKGVLRESWAGMESTFSNSQEGRENAFTASQADKESRFQAFLESSGYIDIGPYAAGVEFTARNQYVAVGGQFFRPAAGTLLPYTATGDWATESGNFVLLGDDVLRQGLASATGATMVGMADGATVQGEIDALNLRLSGVANTMSFGSIGDGSSHPLSERFATLADAQVVYPHAAALTQEIDFVAIQAALNAGKAVVHIPGGQYRIDPSGLVWPSGVRIECYGTLVRVGTPTAPCLLASTAGTFHLACGSFDDGGHSAQFGMLEVDHVDAVLITSQFVWAHNGYSCIWARNAKAVDIGGGEFWDASHNLYFGQNNSANLPCSVQRVTVRGAISHHARPGGDGLKTVSGVKKLSVIGGRYYANAQDGIDLFAGCDEAMLIGVDCSGNTVNGADIKIGFAVDYPASAFGARRPHLNHRRLLQRQHRDRH
ncbi:hypothetical protein [Stutzerimonas stutzeri]|uniref:hypothetical protein n=1 Tax=Stutzerimonas stutzeri TaxID=316 RepID=UPI0015E27DBB|nr:hypothetical protein [Stutzerimonas stutzeri]MBA1278126.1 hypothetical protein [Stutzerimonas stutzeri]